MFNRLCCPEMPFDKTSDGKIKVPVPHAYVAYTDGGKETVPISFIYNFPTKWREPRENGGWDPTYLYKVFWSPDDNDSPAKMLQRCVEIETFEGGTAQEKPGYYRAAVVKVKGLLLCLISQAFVSILFISLNSKSTAVLLFSISPLQRKVSLWCVLKCGDVPLYVSLTLYELNKFHC